MRAVSDILDLWSITHLTASCLYRSMLLPLSSLHWTLPSAHYRAYFGVCPH